MSTAEIISIVLGIACFITLLVVIYYVKRPHESRDELKLDLMRNEIKSSFETISALNSHFSQTVLSTIKDYNESVLSQMTKVASLQSSHFDGVQQRLDALLKTATQTLEKGLSSLQKSNEDKLEQMRSTVDEKLNSSLEKRLSESFNIINVRLQSVYEGLGEMKQLATGVGDLKKVLTNVKTRGTWGEVQLGNLLEQMLASNQYSAQVQIKKNGERVDFAINMPGKDDKNILLPIDAKFPIEDYQRLITASEIGEATDIELSSKNLERRIKDEAKKISSKYIDIPNTTDFAVMYLPIEGLYAEALRRDGLAESLQRDYKVMLCGPTTISALINSLQMGFKTLAIEKRSSEIWGLLGAFKQEFGKFVELLSKTQKKLSEASNSIESATKKSLTIQRKLKNVQIDDSDDIPLLEEEKEDDDE